MYCDLCGSNTVTDEQFCYGCSKHVCNDCSVNDNLPFGGHDIEDHQDDFLDDEIYDEDDDDC